MRERPWYSLLVCDETKESSKCLHRSGIYNAIAPQRRVVISEMLPRNEPGKFTPRFTVFDGDASFVACLKKTTKPWRYSVWVDNSRPIGFFADLDLKLPELQLMFGLSSRRTSPR